MSVSSVNSGFVPNQAALTNNIPQRTTGQPPFPATAEKSPEAATGQGTQTAIAGPGTPTPLANRVGVAAYVAIMNPQTPTSMRAEA